MKINKIILLQLVLCLVLGLVFTSCDEEIGYTPAPIPEGAQVFFSKDLPTRINLSQDLTADTYFEVELRRVETSGALTVALSAEFEKDGIFVVPASVSFEAGSGVTKIRITYEHEFLIDEYYDNFWRVSLSVNDHNTPYGHERYAFTAGIPGPWKSLGMAKVTVTDFMRLTDVEVELLQNELNPNFYRMIEPFAERRNFYSNILPNDSPSPIFEFYILPKETTYTTWNREAGTHTFTTTVDGLIAYEPTLIGMSHDVNGRMAIWHPAARSYPVDGGDPHTPAPPESFFHKNIVTKWSADGKPEVIQIAPWFVTLDGPTLGSGWNETQSDGIFTIVFPGVVFSDYSAEIAYKGRYTDPSENHFAIADVKLGEDVEYARVGLAPGGMTQAALDGVIAAIIEGDDKVDNVVKITESGEVRIPCQTQGRYTLIVVTYGDGEYREFDFVTFNFITGESYPIESLFGDYTMSGFNLTNNAAMTRAVQIEAGEEPNTVTITGSFTGATPPETLIATFIGNGSISILPQDLGMITFEGEEYELFSTHILKKDRTLSRTLPMILTRLNSGVLVVRADSETFGFTANISLGRFFGMYDITFTPEEVDTKTIFLKNRFNNSKSPSLRAPQILE
jgi:hypothetical protein